jgi:hypothetical protein
LRTFIACVSLFEDGAKWTLGVQEYMVEANRISPGSPVFANVSNTALRGGSLQLRTCGVVFEKSHTMQVAAMSAATLPYVLMYSCCRRLSRTSTMATNVSHSQLKDISLSRVLA